ncbi:helix-turn-helix domain-containing protein [Streptomyces sp. NPDC051677]|uniref:helix-turn-helix domain-containing protein n=1 Tax=Streptomyces sp. NPDC051677 TaxID=3365669 RepID=UPI0037D16E10
MELSVVEQRYRAVLAVLAGATVTEVAAQLGRSRQAVTAHVSDSAITVELDGQVRVIRRTTDAPVRNVKANGPNGKSLTAKTSDMRLFRGEADGVLAGFVIRRAWWRRPQGGAACSRLRVAQG